MSEEAQDGLCDTPHIIRETLHEDTQDSPEEERPEEAESPEVLGMRGMRAISKSKALLMNQTRNSSRHLQFQDLSPMVKSCNTFVFDQASNAG